MRCCTFVPGSPLSPGEATVTTWLQLLFLEQSTEKRWQHLSFSLKQSKQRAQRVYAGMHVSVYMPALFLETLTVGK